MPVTNPPFTRQPVQPPFHLRPLEPEEIEQLRRMQTAQEIAHKLMEGKSDGSKKDS